MELPHLGQNCALMQCNQLDFLPVKCDACSKVFCLKHYQYYTHNCEKAKSRDVQVPVCPLCSEPVPSKKGQMPDLAVSQHIDQYCRQNELLAGKIAIKPKATNLQTCNYKSCKQKDLIYLECSDCYAKFCIKHRHPSDHSCPGPKVAHNLANNWQSFKGSCSNSATSGFEIIKNKAQQISKSGQAALNRLAASSSGAGSSRLASRTQANSSNQKVNVLQGHLSEQEALSIALNESKKAGNGSGVAQEDEDLALARAIHESQLEARSRVSGNGNNTKDSCILS